MKLFVRGEYHNNPAGLHFDKAGVVELDKEKVEFLLRDAPENFTTELPETEVKSLDEPKRDKMVKEPTKKK